MMVDVVEIDLVDKVIRVDDVEKIDGKFRKLSEDIWEYDLDGEEVEIEKGIVVTWRSVLIVGFGLGEVKGKCGLRLKCCMGDLVDRI